jgi:hypothetical protein
MALDGSIECAPLKFLNFDFSADPDPAFHSNADLIRIRIQFS